MLNLKTSAFENGAMIPDRFAKGGKNVSPPLEWTGAPAQTSSFVLIVDDPDAPSGLFDHWLLYGIPAKTTSLPEGVPATPELPDGSRQGINGYGDVGYGGPQPPSGKHRYFFHLYAIDTESNLQPGLSRAEIEAAIEDHVIDEVQLMGWYEHKEKTLTA